MFGSDLILRTSWRLKLLQLNFYQILKIRKFILTAILNRTNYQVSIRPAHYHFEPLQSEKTTATGHLRNVGLLKRTWGYFWNSLDRTEEFRGTLTVSDWVTIWIVVLASSFVSHITDKFLSSISVFHSPRMRIFCLNVNYCELRAEKKGSKLYDSRNDILVIFFFRCCTSSSNDRDILNCFYFTRVVVSV